MPIMQISLLSCWLLLLPTTYANINLNLKSSALSRWFSAKDRAEESSDQPKSKKDDLFQLNVAGTLHCHLFSSIDEEDNTIHPLLARPSSQWWQPSRIVTSVAYEWLGIRHVTTLARWQNKDPAVKPTIIPSAMDLSYTVPQESWRLDWFWPFPRRPSDNPETPRRMVQLCTNVQKDVDSISLKLPIASWVSWTAGWSRKFRQEHSTLETNRQMSEPQIQMDALGWQAVQDYRHDNKNRVGLRIFRQWDWNCEDPVTTWQLEWQGRQQQIEHQATLQVACGFPAWSWRLDVQQYLIGSRNQH